MKKLLLLLLVAAFNVCAWAEPTNIGSTNSTWEIKGSTLEIYMYGVNDIKNQESDWSWGSNLPFSVSSVTTLKLTANSEISSNFSGDFLYLFFGSSSTIKNIDMSEMGTAQVGYLVGSNDNLSKSDITSRTGMRYIFPDEYDTSSLNYGSNVTIVAGGSTPEPEPEPLPTGHIEKESFDNTLILTCTGDICEPDNTYDGSGLKFNATAYDVIFSNQDGKTVNNGDVYDGNTQYYTRTANYIHKNINTYTEDVYTFKNDVELFKGVDQWNQSTKETPHHYLSVSGGDKYDDNAKYYTRQESDDYTQITDFSSYVTNKTFFDSRVNDIFLAKSNGDRTYTKIIENVEYVDGSYYLLTDAKKQTDFSSLLDAGNKFNSGATTWIGKRTDNTVTLVSEGEDYDSEAEYYPMDHNTAAYSFSGWTSQKEVFTTSVFMGDEKNVVAIGTIKDNDATYFIKDYDYTEVEESSLKSDSYTEFTQNTRVNPGSEKYYLGDMKTPVNNNELFSGNQDDYWVIENYTYNHYNASDLEASAYVYSATVAENYWQALVNEINAAGYKTVVFKTKEGETSPARICNTVTQSLMKVTTVRELNLEGVGIQQITSPFTSVDMSGANSNGTFVCADNSYGSNNSIETLYTPMILGTTDAEKTLSWAIFERIPSLRYLYLSEGIETLGAKSVMARSYHLSTITFPNSLKYIKADAVSGHGSTKTAEGNSNKLYDKDGIEIEYIQTLTFPAGLLEIESGAFAGTTPKDVYFLGVDAPRVGLHAWGDDAYISNNALTPAGANIGTEGATVTVDLQYGRACRYNYTAQSGWLAMLHYPTACTKEQAAKYTDVTRDYRRIVYDENPQGDPTMSYADSGTAWYTYYTPGKETSPITGKGHATSLAASKTFGNMYAWGDGTSFPATIYPEGYYGGNYSGGYYDYNVGEQYLWPSMGMAYRATVVAQNDVLWDGVTTIGDGIRNAGNASFVGDGSEYIGLHQFVFAAADVKGESTTDWEMEKYADGIWHTICLPFNMTKRQMKETFGAAGRDSNGDLYYNIKLCKFDHVKRNESLIQLYFTDEQFNNNKFGEDQVVLQAHVSYMIKAEKDKAINPVVFHNFIMEPGSPIPTQLACDPESTRPTQGKYRFVGNYTKFATAANAAPTEIKIPKYSYFFSGTYHKYRFQTGNTGIWSPYSSVVYTPEGAGEDDFNTYFNGVSTTMLLSRVSTFYEQDETPTNVMAVVVGDDELVYTNASVYTISGQYVGNSINGLLPGIYIVNGKKYSVNK